MFICYEQAPFIYKGRPLICKIKPLVKKIPKYFCCACTTFYEGLLVNRVLLVIAGKFLFLFSNIGMVECYIIDCHQNHIDR